MSENEIINLPDGYNGHTVPFFAKPIYEGESIVWLRCAISGKEYMKRWAHKSTWLAAKRSNPNYPFSASLRFCPLHNQNSDVIAVIECQNCVVEVRS